MQCVRAQQLERVVEAHGFPTSSVKVFDVSDLTEALKGVGAIIYSESPLVNGISAQEMLNVSSDTGLKVDDYRH